MNQGHIVRIAKELNISAKQVKSTIELLDDAASVPFIARYRKEATGSLDEVAITSIRDRITQLRELDSRREAILKSLEERELLTDELIAKIAAAQTLAELEDIYLPYRPKRRTRATIAREKGLEPLAELIFTQQDINLELEAGKFIDAEKEVHSVDDALAGARDIVAEWVNENQEARIKIRSMYAEKGTIRSKVVPGKEEEGKKYRDYFQWEEPVMSAPSHRILAMRRGENEGYLSVHISIPDIDAVFALETQFILADNEASGQVKLAVSDGYKRLLAPSMETEINQVAKENADKEAINVFADNVKQLLLASPLGQKRVLALDPGFRTGCKLVCLDTQGKLLHNETIYPHTSEAKFFDASAAVLDLCKRYKIEIIAIGNGTAGRETESFIKELELNIPVVMVNESGASIYSASDVAREEFPDYDVTVRGAVSIGRRLMDPLAELVKIDPKSIGVGQYQHDVDQSALKNRLDDVVMSCVNWVGVELNTASKQLLTYVSGLGPKLAENIVKYRDEKGAFKSRAEIKQVPRLGPKAFEQAAGFLRIRDAQNPLDRSAVHPESYAIVDRMARDLNCKVQDLIEDENLRKKIDLTKYITETVGIPTLTDILAELAKPGRDPREQFEPFEFAKGVNTLEDLKVGIKLPGIVTNVTAFGAFVDIGVHQDGLVHISQLSNSFVKNPHDIVKVQQRVTVTVTDIDIPRKRISLSMR